MHYMNANNRDLMPPMITPSFTDVMHFLPAPITTTTINDNHIFKYMIGDKFADPEFEGDTIEITGFNWVSRTYEGVITMKFGDKYKQQKANLISENRLDKMAMLVEPLIPQEPKDTKVRYRIHYFDTKTGKTSKQRDVELSNIRALAKLLNVMIKHKTDRRIIAVSVIDENGFFISSVKFLRKEIKEQKFLTGMKERLLAHAKYECGYEIATNF